MDRGAEDMRIPCSSIREMVVTTMRVLVDSREVLDAVDVVEPVALKLPVIEV